MYFAWNHWLACCILILASFTLDAQSVKPVQEIILIGDAGELDRDGHAVLKALLKAQDSIQTKSTALFFLGDNIYPAGLPDTSHSRYPVYQAILDTQWKAGLQLAKQVYFIPGNHDWAKGHSNGLQQIKNQGDYIRNLNQPNLHFLPADGCPGPEEISLTDDLTAIIMDSQWWLHAGDKPGVTSDCDCKTEEEILFRLQEILFRNQDKTILFLTHHSFVSTGIHGGYYQFKQHLFPLTDLNPDLYIPLPIIGSLYPIIRGGFGNIQDNKHPQYKNMSGRVDTILNLHPRVIRAAGHEHGLQHIVLNENQYIVSGAGSKATRHRKNQPNRTGFSTTGYAKLQWFGPDSLMLVLMEATADVHREVYRQLISLPPPRESKTAPLAISTFTDSVHRAAAPYFKAGAFKKKMFGTNYRQEWSTPVTVPVISIGTIYGGLKPTRRGGGMQSRSLRLEDSTGKEFVLRSIEKYPDKTLPEELRQTFVKDAIVDGISASYPFAALSVPPLLQATKIPHTKPMLVFLPDDPALGQYRSDFANKLYLFESRVPDELDKTYSTDKVVEALAKDNDNLTDQQAVLKARLLDMFIMDFDRHDDQWRWGRIKTKEGNRYFPVPRDRDQAFFINTGWIPWLISRSWLIPKFQGFRSRAQNINTFNYNARYFDRSFLNRTSRNDWEQTVQEILQQLSDSIIDQALAEQPAEIRKQAAPTIAATLKKRKEYLLEDALRYQQFLHRTMDIAGSNKKDWFELDWKKTGELNLTIYDVNKEGKAGDRISEQRINPDITRELRLYGLGGADVFHLKGAIPKGIKIRIISGEGADSLIAGHSSKRKKAVIWYDQVQESSQFSGNGSLKQKFSSSPSVHTYDRKNFKYNITAPLLLLTYNRDDGVFMGAGIKSTRHSFRKKPYAFQHQFNAYYAVATGAYQFRYILDAPLFRFHANLKAPNNTRNFFGFGNQTRFIRNNLINITHYRSRFNLFELGALAKYQPIPSLLLNAGPIFQHYWIDYDDNENRFITKPESGLDQERLKQQKTWLGLQAQTVLDTRNHENIPSSGVQWINTARWANGLSHAARSFTQWETALSYYIGLMDQKKLVFAGRIGAGASKGNYEFFQAQHLGGNESLRGYRNFRFAGDQRFYNNFDLRIQLTQLRGYILPGTLGLLLFQDIGRVWWQDEKSGRWHAGYGGGIWLAPANRFVVAACYGQSDEGGLPFVSLGFQF